MIDSSKIIDDILKSATVADLGPGVMIDLKDTKDNLGYEISVGGSFRHGGVSKEEVIKILQDAFKKLDIDI